ncbi:MAG: rplD, partial [Acidimicrobiaceae bacterium]|nr:rplD [Acidimicrobiaceae bacterium]
MSTALRAERRLLDPVTVARTSATGESLGQVTLDPEVFSVPVNVPLLHQVITAQLAARRAGTHSTRTRAEVKGGSAKPFRQKGTGNARQGSIRAPHYSGGGVAFGPKPRDYSQKTPKKMVQAALRCALSDRALTGGVRLIDQWTFEVPKTKDAVASLESLECEGTVLVVLDRKDETAARSFSNLGHVMTIPADQLTAYDVMSADVVVFTDETLPGTATAAEGAAPAKKAAAKKAPAKKAAAKKAPVAESPALDAD